MDVSLLKFTEQRNSMDKKASHQMASDIWTYHASGQTLPRFIFVSSR